MIICVFVILDVRVRCGSVWFVKLRCACVLRVCVCVCAGTRVCVCVVHTKSWRRDDARVCACVRAALVRSMHTKT